VRKVHFYYAVVINFILCSSVFIKCVHYLGFYYKCGMGVEQRLPLLQVAELLGISVV
jgi:hypothetical protein